MSDAITREEKLMEAIATGSPSNIKPITREEMFLAKAGGQDVETPEPITRREKLLQGIIDNGGGGTKVEGTIAITENGTYDVAAYASADVNVESAGGGDIDALIDGSITEVESDVSTLRAYCFYSCLNLKKATFSTVSSIDVSAFAKCSKLTDISFPKATYIMNSAFSGCSALKNVEMPLASSINNSAFQETGIEKIILPRVVKINGSAFNNCDSLRVVDLSNNSTSQEVTFKSSAFYHSGSITALIIRTRILAVLDNTNAFGETPIASGTGYIYVPSSLVDSYKSATNWSTYANQFRALEDYTVDGTTAGALDESKI